jgi:membrane associated rhomboid family serine protease
MTLCLITFIFVTYPELKLPFKETKTYAYAFIPAGDGELWRLISYQFLHSSVGHLVSNLWYFAIFGWILESLLGPWLFLSLAVSAGALAVLPERFLQLQPDLPVVGASGAIAFAMGAVLALYPWSRIRFLMTLVPLPQFPNTFYLPMRYLVYFWLFLQVSGLAMNHWVNAAPVAYGTHLLGFGLGLVLGYLFRSQRTRDFLDIELSGDDLARFYHSVRCLGRGEKDEALVILNALSEKHRHRTQVQTSLLQLCFQFHLMGLASRILGYLIPEYLVLRRRNDLEKIIDSYHSVFDQPPPLSESERVRLRHLLKGSPTEPYLSLHPNK